MTNTRIADSLRAKANGFTGRIAHLQQPRLENTRKRRDEAEARQRDMRKLIAAQALMLKLAGLHEAGAVPEALAKLRHASDFENVCGVILAERRHREEYPNQHRQELKDPYATAAGLLDAAGSLDASKESKLAKLVRDIAGHSIPGYFPTPPAICDRLVEMAEMDDEGAYTVADLSAGDGAIADAVLRLRHTCTMKLHVCEYNYSLRGILEAKGHNVVGADLFAMHPQTIVSDGKPGYDRIILNPPFENGQDIEHVQYCYEKFLRPGGILVAILSESAFFRMDKKFAAFRQYFQDTQLLDMGAISVKLPQEAFKPSGTMVSTRIIKMIKPVLAVGVDSASGRGYSALAVVQHGIGGSSQQLHYATFDSAEVDSSTFDLMVRATVRLSDQGAIRVTPEQIAEALNACSEGGGNRVTANRHMMRMYLAASDPVGTV